MSKLAEVENAITHARERSQSSAKAMLRALHTQKIVNYIQSKLTQYEFRPMLLNEGFDLYPLSPGKYSWRTGFRAVRRANDFQVFDEIGTSPALSRIAFRDGDAVLRLLDLAGAGLLSRLRRCDKCKKWFYARFQHQKFCDLNCQQMYFRSSKKWKAHRRAWMQEYRAKKELPNVK